MFEDFAPTKVKGRFRDIFYPNEDILWIGRPGKKAIRALGREDGFFYLFIAVMCFLIWAAGFGLFLYSWQIQTLVVPLLFSLPLAAALMGARKIVTAPVRQSRTVYVVTRGRNLEIFFGPGGEKIIRNYKLSPQDLKVVWREGGRGDVIVVVKRGSTEFGPGLNRSYGFFDIGDPGRVFDLLKS